MGIRWSADGFPPGFCRFYAIDRMTPYGFGEKTGGIDAPGVSRTGGRDSADFGGQRGCGVNDEGNRGDLDASGNGTEYGVSSDGRGTRERYQGDRADAAGIASGQDPFDS